MEAKDNANRNQRFGIKLRAEEVGDVQHLHAEAGILPYLI